MTVMSPHHQIKHGPRAILKRSEAEWKRFSLRFGLGLLSGDPRVYWNNFWQRAHRRKVRWAEDYFNSWEAPHRRELVNRLNESPFESLLELGCNSGPNLRALWEAGCRARLHGVDVNRQAVEYGRARFSELGISSVTLEERSLYDLHVFTERFDVIIAVAVLMHIPPEGCQEVLQSALRLAKKRLVIVDAHRFAARPGDYPTILNPKDSSMWLRDWWQILAPLVPRQDISITALSPGAARTDTGDINAIIDVRVSHHD